MEHIEAPVFAGEREPRSRLGPPPIWIFSLLILSPAVYTNGFVSTVLSSLLRSEHMSLGDIANVTALMSLPQTIYFFWSPMVDFWVRRRTWVAVSATAAGLMLGTALQFPILGDPGPKFILFLGMCVVLLAHAAVGGLMAALVPPDLKARAGGFYQMGNCGLAALAGGGMLYASAHLARREFGIVSGLMVALPGLVALTIREPGVVGRGDTFGAVLGRIRVEFKDTFFQWKAVPILLILAAPFGSGAALGLLPSLAPDYGISVDQVAWMNGLGGGLLTALGALLIGFLRMPGDLRPLYAWMGLINAATLGILLIGTPRPVTYFVSVTLYMISVGACYALFTAVVLKLLGISGKSGGSRYSIALSIGNLPIFYMTIVDGMGARWFGTKGEPGIDMAVSGAGAVLALLWFWWEGRRTIDRRDKLRVFAGEDSR